jgi:NTE family protein
LQNVLELLTPEERFRKCDEVALGGRPVYQGQLLRIDECQSDIEHLVISGGGVTGFAFYGALRASQMDGLWDIHNIKSIYGTSIGAIFGSILTLLKYFDWEMIDDYALKRPWHHLFHFHLDSVLQSIHNRGIFDKTVIEKLCLPFFEALNYKVDTMEVGVDVTLAQWYELTHIDLHLVTTELTEFKTEVLNHKTHPTWRLVDAIYASCAIPVLFQPFTLEHKMYMDGGLLNNYPAELCIQNGANPDTIFGIMFVAETDPNATLENVGTLLDYILYILNKMLGHVNSSTRTLKYQLNMIAPSITLMRIYEVTRSIEERKQLMDYGVETYTKWASLLAQSQEDEETEN